MHRPEGTVWGDALPGGPELAGRGSLAVGFTERTWTDPDRLVIRKGKNGLEKGRAGRALKLSIFYPAVSSREDVEYTDYMGRADLGNLQAFTYPGRGERDAEPLRSAFPAVVVSHGYPGSRMLLSNLCENLASKGYVAVAIGHTDNTYEDFLKEGSLESALVHRSADQRYVIAHLDDFMEDEQLHDILNPGKVGLIGFSMGGYGALRTLGARWSEAALTEYPDIAEDLREAEDFRGDPHVTAGVLFAPAVFWLDENRLQDLTAPTLFVCGTADRTVGYDRVRSFWEKAGNSDRYLVSYQACGHNVANNPAPACAMGESWEIFKRWADPVWDSRNLNQLNAHFVTAFLDTHLKGVNRLSFLEEFPLPGFREGCAAGVQAEKG